MPKPTPTSRRLRSSLAAAIATGRRAHRLSQAELADKAGVSRQTVAAVEGGHINVSFDTGCLLLDALDIESQLVLRQPLAIGGGFQRDRAHALLVARVRRELEALGWQVRTEVEVGGGGIHGWMDIFAWHPVGRAALVVEIKSAYEDHGAIERQVSWYERDAWTVARRLGLRPLTVRAAVVFLWTSAVDDRVVANSAGVAATFRIRASAMLRWFEDPRQAWPRGQRGIALVDPRSRRRAWLRPTRLDGRRTAAPYADYAGFCAKLDRGRQRRSVRRAQR